MVKTEEKKQEFVTKEYLDERLGKLLEVVEKIAETKETVYSPKAEEARIEKLEAQSNKIPVPVEWNFYIDDHLGKDIGRSLIYPKSGTGFNLHLSIPKELSNAGDAHWEYYHHDFRTKAIDPREGFEGVKRFVDLVAQNLKLDVRSVADRNNKNALK